ncbi:ATP-binding cassette domain-containing protein [Catenovulum maritimum]|uniref:ABC transporter domain-containing protein n=1 Tax=Catenovulum maritimum TaxID=1513271 RepID=A0A0J8GXY5_9ALTE|nr:ATP-binding cassette domain-containing protein [Catenovulum maritimum]KMT65588.1 hypothetical protein XM47_07775 [Catenovulum maritimum]
MSLQVENFSLAFDDLVLFDDANFSIESGKIICLHTGVLDGGTSFLKACAGIIKFQQGRIVINNHNLADMNANQIFKNVSYCYEEGGLVSLFTVFNNLAMPLRYHKGLKEKIITDRIYQVAQQLNIEPLLEMEPHQLNDVQKRIVNLARALVIRPKLILADELQSGMSPEMRENTLNILIDYTQETNASILMTTTAGDTTHFADSVYKIENQTIVLT